MPSLVFLPEDLQTTWARLWALFVTDGGLPIAAYWANFVSWLSQPRKPGRDSSILASTC